MNFQPVDQLPIVEIAIWWDKTIDRWKEEGLPVNICEIPPSCWDEFYRINEYFGIDVYRQWWLAPLEPDFPKVEGHGKGVVRDFDSYNRAKKRLYPKNPFDKAEVEEWTIRQERGEIVIWFTLEGFFWVARELFGVEEHLYAFYDQPELMHTINQDLLEFNLRVLEEFCEICRPDFMTFAEDMSYKSGPMISKALFDEFMATYYREIVPRLKQNGIIPFLDSDGNIEELVPWFYEVGINGFLPLERQAGVDIISLRQKYPTIKLIGAYDKMVMTQGESEIRAEFERILPVMKQGGYIPSVDHQTPPGVSLKNYKIYLQLLREYCSKGTIV